MNKIYIIFLVIYSYTFIKAQTYNLHLRPGKDRIYVDSIFINGKHISGVFVFDTGASKTFIASNALPPELDYKNKWKLHKYCNTYFGKKKTSRGQFSEIRIGEIKLKDFDVEILDWEEFNNPCFEEQTIGLIGLDIIKKYHWYFDLEKHIGYASEKPINSEGYGYLPIKKQFNSLCIYTNENFLKKNPLHANKYLLDTGNPSTILINYKEAEKSKLPEGIEVNRLFSSTFIKSHIYMNEINYNSATYEKKIEYSENAETTIGLGFFRDSKLIIPQDLTKIYYSKLTSDSLIIPKTGFKLTKQKNSNIEIDILYKNSPAEKAGLTLGDALVQINNTNLADIDCSKLNDFIEKEAEKDKMTITLKNGKTVVLLLN